LAACCLDCASCETYIAHQANDLEKKQDIAERWSKHYDGELTTFDIVCDGCMSDGNRFIWCKRCPIRDCVKDKGLNNCAECEIGTCETNAYLFKVSPEAKATMEKLRNK
ncbi:MAG: DUF3795 domain-containing protein, partial [Candidatus Cloacimonadaceae bacterium]